MKKLGLVFTPNNTLDWHQTHIQNPTPVPLTESIFRVFLPPETSTTYQGLATLIWI